MAQTFQDLMMGFGVALSPENLMFAFLGSLLGTVVGILPGIGPSAGAALLIPLTYQLPPTGAIIMLAAIYYGSCYGGTITTVLMAVPGEANSVVTLLDGHQMAKQGRAGAALSIAAIGSFIGGTVATIGLVVAAPPLARAALGFGPPEHFGLMVLGLSLVTALAGDSILRALIMAIFGMMLAMVGMDAVWGMPRFTFDQGELLDGFEFVSVIMGLFGVSEILLNLETPARQVFKAKLTSLIPTRRDMADSGWPITRGTVIGFALGLIPGMTGTVSTFLSYVTEKRLSRYPDKFGTGVIEGVAGPETANNAHANGALLPLFTLGIPASPTAAVIMSAFIMNGLIPGPLLFRDQPQLVWGVIASMVVGNIVLLILNLPLIPMWVQVLKIPYSILLAFILLFIFIGSYSVNNAVFDVWVVIGFGVVGYVCKKLDLPMAPAILTFILAPLMEKNLNRALVMSQGDFSIFVQRPMSLVLISGAVLILVSFAIRAVPAGIKAARKEAENAEL